MNPSIAQAITRAIEGAFARHALRIHAITLHPLEIQRLEEEVGKEKQFPLQMDHDGREFVQKFRGVTLRPSQYMSERAAVLHANTGRGEAVVAVIGLP